MPHGTRSCFDCNKRLWHCEQLERVFDTSGREGRTKCKRTPQAQVESNVKGLTGLCGPRVVLSTATARSICVAAVGGPEWRALLGGGKEAEETWLSAVDEGD